MSVGEREDQSLGRWLTSPTLLHLRYAVRAADLGSFRQAAEALRLRQSTLSRCIRRLEGSAGITLFERSSGGVRATAVGRDFVRAARSILEQIDALMAAAHDTSRGQAGRLAIGFYTSLSAGNLRATLMEYTRRFPEIDLGLLESSRRRLVAALRNGVVDIAIVTGEASLGDSRSMPLWSERILLALPEDHPLTARETIYWTDLRNETIVLCRRDPGPELQDILIAKLVAPADRPKIVLHDVGNASLNSMVCARFGMSLVTEACAGVRLDGLVYRGLRDGSGPATQMFTAHWRPDNDSPALMRFLKLLGERYPFPVTSGVG